VIRTEPPVARGRLWLAGTLLAVAAVFAGVAQNPSPDGGARVIGPGQGVFTFDDYAPLPDRPVRVWYDAPADPATAQILVVMHGMGRDAENYRADWHEQVAAHNVLVLAPEFSEEFYPDAESYNLGNMVDEDGDPLPAEQWSFHVVEALFDYVVRELGSPARDYALFGHSAGAQFVHRFVEFMPTHRARVAVAANAGWYTTLDDSVEFPYGLAGAPSARNVPERAFGSNLVILLGADDTDTDSDSLRQDDGADAQGTHRLARGLHFYRSSREVAERESLEFRWRLMVVPGIAHSHEDVAPVAAPLLLERGR
jgi:poly(3-hydroxybutyrate) depolymerase